jgi:hypothetical protein
MSKDHDLVRGIESICLHGGYLPDETTSRGVPLYRTAPYKFKDTDTAARLFALQELGNIVRTAVTVCCVVCLFAVLLCLCLCLFAPVPVLCCVVEPFAVER